MEMPGDHTEKTITQCGLRVRIEMFLGKFRMAALMGKHMDWKHNSRKLI
jgi:hypothetical protein